MVGVFAVSEVVSVTRHCLYLPEGSPDMTGEVPPTLFQDGEASPALNGVSLALASKVISVLLTNVSSQKSMFQIAPAAPVSSTWDARVPEETYADPLLAAFNTVLIMARRLVPLQVAVGFSVLAVVVSLWTEALLCELMGPSCSNCSV